MSGKYLTVFNKDSVQTAYDKLEKALNKTASKSIPKNEKEAKKPWVSTQSSDLNSDDLHGKDIKSIAILRTTTH